MPNAIISGATQGIGKAIAEKLLSEGFNVAICARTAADLEAVKEQWNKEYPEATVITYKADLSVKQEAQDFAAHVLATFKEIEILVNNAGMFFPGNLMDEPDGHLENLMGINMYSAYYLTRAVVPAIVKHGKGYIVNMCSVASLKAYPQGGAYGISKYALLGFTENIRQELMGDGIRVTAVCHGATISRSWEGAGIDPDRMMNAEDIADMVWAAYSLSPKADVETLVMRPIKGDL